ncbi:MAG: hypothetical protein ABFD18_17385 [Syntrophomonas sp.]
MLGIKRINRNEHGVIANIELSDDSRVSLEELYRLLDKQNVGGAFVSYGPDGAKEYHLVNDGDYGEKLESLELF